MAGGAAYLSGAGDPHRRYFPGAAERAVLIRRLGRNRNLELGARERVFFDNSQAIRRP